ncbi:MAG TPA: glycosyltransferase [Allosphingosinicella sp.]|uniref:glycosyltransferase n=1 Tax=Allosphingosinicella sp. TaxID=2823234 RepID=UPI002F284F09
MSGPTISVAMSVHNNAPHLAPAIESILAQTFGDFEFLIVNDGATDGSGAIIDAYAARDERIRAIHQENRGLIASLNRLLNEARAPLVARMDGDDIALPARFERQLAFLHAHPNHGVVGTWTLDIDETGGPRAETPRDQPTSHEAVIATLETVNPLCHPSVMMRRDAVLAAGGYHAGYRHCEDYDLWLRMSESTRLCSIPERLMLYRHSASQVSNRHILAQAIGAAIAWLAHVERREGRPDPTENLATLPPIGQLDDLFGRRGIDAAVRAKVAASIVHSPLALRGEGYQLLLDHVRTGGAKAGLWRTAGRLVKFREPARALRLAAALAVR